MLHIILCAGEESAHLFDVSLYDLFIRIVCVLKLYARNILRRKAVCVKVHVTINANYSTNP